MYIIQCIKSGVCDFYFNESMCLGAWFRKNQYIAIGGEATRSLKRAMVFNTKNAVRDFMENINSDLNEDEPVPVFKTIPVSISLK